MTCFNINGQSVRKYCEKNGINYTAFYYWMNKVGDDEEAIKRAKISKEKGKKIIHWYKGKPMRQVCKQYGIKYTTVLNRIHRTNMSVEESIKVSRNGNTPSGAKAKLKYKGKSLHSYCKENGLSYNSVYFHISKKKSIKEALACAYGKKVL